jgi:hypothetical protein
MNGSETSLIPPSLLPKIRAAEEEHREPAQVVREALERHMEDREWRKLFEYGESCAKWLSLAKEDVPWLIAEYCQENRQGKA